MKDWDRFWINLCQEISKKSKDRSTKVGAVIVDTRQVLLSIGWNGFPRGVNDNIEERHQRPAKYKWTEHAERNAIYNAAAKGISLLGSIIYIPWFPCSDCARGIVQSGIFKVICSEPNFEDPIYGEDFKVAYQILKEGCCSITYQDFACLNKDRKEVS